MHFITVSSLCALKFTNQVQFKSSEHGAGTELTLTQASTSLKTVYVDLVATTSGKTPNAKTRRPLPPPLSELGGTPRTKPYPRQPARPEMPQATTEPRAQVPAGGNRSP